MAHKPIIKSRKFQVFVITSVVALAVYGGKALINYFSEKAKNKLIAENEEAEAKYRHEQRKEEERLRAELCLKKEDQKHQHKMAFEELRHKNKMEAIRTRHSEDYDSVETDADEDYSLLPSVNVGQLVNKPIADEARIKYLGETYIQNRDIMVLYGPSGIGKSHEVIDLLSEITTGTSQRVTIPLKDKIALKFKAFYYDKEPDDLEWSEKFKGRNDLENIERIPCRNIDVKQLLKDIKTRLEHTQDTNVIIVIDPITNFDIKPSEIHRFIGELANVQEYELKSGRNLVFIMNAHSIKNHRDSILSDLGGSKYWAESVKTVVSLMPAGTNDCYRKLTFDKTKNGREVTRGSSFILRPAKTPHLHFNYSEELTNEYCNQRIITGSIIESEESTKKKTKRRGKLQNITSEDVNLMIKMREEGESFKAISESIGKKFNLYPMEISRLIQDHKDNGA